MTRKNINILKENIITTYKKYGDEKILSSGTKSYSGTELANEVTNETQFGIELIDNLIQLTIDLLKRDKLKYPSKYRDTYIKDIHNQSIIEGSIINANGYNSNIEEKYFHCVVYYDGQFGSDIYSDFEPLSSYKNIEVVGHCEDFKHILKTDEWSGNLGESIKK